VSEVVFGFCQIDIQRGPETVENLSAKMGPKKDNPKPKGLWISPPRRWLFVLIPLVAVIACSTFIRNAYVYEQFRYSLNEKFFNCLTTKTLLTRLGLTKIAPLNFKVAVLRTVLRKSQRPSRLTGLPKRLYLWKVHNYLDL
jgi:hypothetical protein